MITIQTLMATRIHETDLDLDELKMMLEEIEREEMPECLLVLAWQLQMALAARRVAGGQSRY